MNEHLLAYYNWLLAEQSKCKTGSKRYIVIAEHLQAILNMRNIPANYE